MENAYRRKEAFDKKVEARAPREVIFKAGQLVQIYRSDLDYTFKAIRKLEPKWSAPRRVISRKKNSYKLETLEGLPIEGRFSSRRLRRFIPRNGTSLQEAQKAVEEALGLAEERVDAGEVAEENMDMESEALVVVDNDAETTPDSEGNNREESGPGEEPITADCDDEKSEGEADDDDKRSEGEAENEEGPKDPVEENKDEQSNQSIPKQDKGPRRSKRLLGKFFSKVLAKIRP